MTLSPTTADARIDADSLVNCIFMTVGAREISVKNL